MGENSVDGRARRMLARMLHRGRFAEVSADPAAARRLIRLGYAVEWRTALGREAIVFTERGVMEAEHAAARDATATEGGAS